VIVAKPAKGKTPPQLRGHQFGKGGVKKSPKPMPKKSGRGGY
jgi:hypothetical protein